MANISSLMSSGTTSSGYSGKGIGGLASGMDTDTLIERMTIATRSKIAKQKQQKQLLSWRSDSYRSITDKLLSFSEKFISLTGSSSLYRESMFARNQITVNGSNSSAVTVSGSSTSISNVSIAAIDELAKQAQLSLNNASSKQLNSGSLNTDDITSTTNHLAGKTISVTFATGTEGRKTTYDVELKTGDGYNYDTVEDAIKSINKSLKEVSVSGAGDSSMTLDKIVKFSVGSDGKVTVNSTNGGELKGDSPVMKALGFSSASANLTSGSAVSDNAMTSDTIQTTTTQSFLDSLNGKSVTFNYNGTSKAVKINIDPNDLASAATPEEKMKAAQKALQKGLDSAFGTGRVKVDLKKDAASGEYNFSMSTTNPSNGNPDNSSTLQVVTGTASALTALGLKSGNANRVDVTKNLANSNMSDDVKNYLTNMSSQVLGLSGADLDNISVKELIGKLNASSAKVNISYAEGSDRLTVTSKEPGASGRVSDLEQYFNGSAPADYTSTEGTDAVIRVKYKDTGEMVTLTRSSNTFDLEGLTVSANKTFNAGVADSALDSDSFITFDAKVNTEKTVNAIKEMVDAYNELVELANSELKTKYDRNYPPLTDEQKEEMSESEIKTWEEKAKQGLLNNDPDIRSLTSAIRFVFSNSGLSAKELESMGITISSDYTENGKITLDEDKLTAALEQNPEKFSNFFAREASNGDQGGVMAKMKSVIDKYAGSEGILLKKAGATSKPSSLLENSLLKQMEDIDETLDQLQRRLKKEQDRYQSQFTQLEQVIANMNSQSSYITSMFG